MLKRRKTPWPAELVADTPMDRARTVARGYRGLLAKWVRALDVDELDLVPLGGVGPVGELVGLAVAHLRGADLVLRERIFVISILRTEDEPNPEYHFPSPIKLESTVEDILEDNVSPEYFLSQPLLEKYLTKADINESIEKLYPEDSNTENCRWMLPDHHIIVWCRNQHSQSSWC